MVLFICFLIFIFLGYLTIWLPFQTKLSDEILRTKQMLEIIPDYVKETMTGLNNLSL